MDRVDVQRRLPSPGRHHRHGGALLGQRRIEHVLEFLQHRRHVPDGAVAEERHRAVRDAPERLDLRPPHAAVPEADAVLVQRFGDDDVLHAAGREPALLRQVRDAAIAARLLVRRAGNLDGPVEAGADVGKNLGRDDRGGEPALHVAGAAAIDPAVPELAPERVGGPAAARFHHIVVRVEVNGLAPSRAFPPRHDVPARMPVAVAGLALCPDELDLVATLASTGWRGIRRSRGNCPRAD